MQIRAAVGSLPGRDVPQPEPGGQSDSDEALWRRVSRLATDPVLREAVAVASTSLAAALRAADAGHPPAKTKDLRRLALSLESYRLRMSTRATPFGLFAGVVPARFATDGWACLRSGHRTFSRPDGGWLSAVIGDLETDPEVLPRLRLMTNPNRVIRGRWVELADRPGADGLALTAPVRAALDAASAPIAFPALVAALTSRWPGASPQSAARMLAGLVHRRFLLTDVRPPSDCADPLGYLLDRLDGHHVAPALRGIRDEMTAYDRAPLGQGGRLLESLGDRMRCVQPVEPAVHVDLALDAEIRIPAGVAREVEQAVETLWRLSPDRPGRPWLREFHHAFLERYGTGRAVPLTELLSEEQGLGLPDAYRQSPQATQRVDRQPGPGADPDRDRLLAQLVTAAVAASRREVTLDDELVERLARRHRPDAEPPASIEVYARLMAPSMPAMCNGEFLVVLGPYLGTSRFGAASGRFAHLYPDRGAELGRLVRQAYELPDGAVPATLVYRPTVERMTNLMTAPHWLPYRVPVGVGSFDTPTTDLPPDDLAVAATAQRLVLQSLRLGREVRPTAFNVVNVRVSASSLVRFIDDLAREGTSAVQAWSWGPMRNAPFLPRVRRGRTVLAAATWRLDRGLLEPTSTADWLRRLADWRENWGVPDRVHLSDGDQLLRIDLDDPLHRQLLQRTCKGRTSMVVHEVLDDEYDDGWLNGPDGTHVCEAVVPLLRRK
ncbi:MAG: lantibiotic dehydratase family protein, partial [Micromonosporaceae bacterium]|nr:lantibiotic dehydratase family protein [Micromonosporaceae bacterium]